MTVRTIRAYNKVMLNLSCQRIGRRNFLRLGALGGACIPGFAEARTLLSQNPKLVKDRAVIFVFMHGGPSQFETFDPKMDAPSEIRSMTGEIPTRIPGVTFGSTFKKLARLNDKFSIVRSFSTQRGSHDARPLVDPKHSSGAHIGSHYARVAGTSHPQKGIPRNVILYPRAVEHSAMPAIMKLGKFNATGPLGSANEPFAPSGEGGLKEDLKIRLEASRLTDRKHLLGAVDKWKKTVDQIGENGGLDHFHGQAFETLLSGVADAFEISQEAPRLIDHYDTSNLIDIRKISKRWNNHERYRDHVNSLGKLLLLARRLAERGSGFISVTTGFVWDMHADANNATMTEGMDYVGKPFDHAVSVLIEDLEARGLQDKVLLVCCGEMGRTPRINKKGGRDHWAGSAPLLLYGGGLKMGQVIGTSDKRGEQPQDMPVRVPDLYATIMDRLLDLGAVRSMAGIPPEVSQVLHSGKPIPGLS